MIREFQFYKMKRPVEIGLHENDGLRLGIVTVAHFMFWVFDYNLFQPQCLQHCTQNSLVPPATFAAVKCGLSHFVSFVH